MAIFSPLSPANRKKSPPKGRSGGGGRARVLVSVTVVGSAGPLRFLIDEGETAAAVIRTALKSYAREGRLPVLGSDLNSFLLYRAHDGSDAMSHRDPISSDGGRNFLLCRKQVEAQETPARELGRRGHGSWKAWLNRSLSFASLAH